MNPRLYCTREERHKSPTDPETNGLMHSQHRYKSYYSFPFTFILHTPYSNTLIQQPQQHNNTPSTSHATKYKEQKSTTRKGIKFLIHSSSSSSSSPEGVTIIWIKLRRPDQPCEMRLHQFKHMDLVQADRLES